MAWVEVNGTDIHYVEKGAGQPLIFLHGMSSCAEAWFQQFEAFAGTYRLIAYDSVNHGHSANSRRGEPEPDRVDELEGVLGALNIERPVLAGNSMGAMTLLRWAIRHPTTAAALIPSGMGVRDAAGATLARWMSEPLDHEVLLLPVGDSFTERFRKEQSQLFERYLRLRSTATRIEALRDPRTPTAHFPDRAELAELVPKIASPMQIVVGEVDRLRPAAERLHELVPHSRFDVIAGAPHNVYYEAADEYNDIVKTFLSGLV